MRAAYIKDLCMWNLKTPTSPPHPATLYIDISTPLPFPFPYIYIDIYLSIIVQYLLLQKVVKKTFKYYKTISPKFMNNKLDS